jgi:succinate dehydrogenase / fumarate reductase, flavoprotein subunit
MNPLSIELYRRCKKDITREPLEFAVNNQHMNGGIAVDVWGRSSLEGCFAIGEASGTNGVTRPGGAALNAGQVIGQRCAEFISDSRRSAPDDLYQQTWLALPSLQQGCATMISIGARSHATFKPA